MRRYVLSAFLPCLVMALPAIAQVKFFDEKMAYDTDRPAAGHWLGNITPGRFPDTWGALSIERDEAGRWKASITILPADVLDLPCEAVEIDGASVAFRVPVRAPQPRFVGEVSPDGQRLRGLIWFGDPAPDQAAEGSFELARMPRPVDLPRPLAFSGELEVPQMGKLAMTLVFAETPGGNWVGHVDVPTQALLGFPLIDVERRGRTIMATLPAAPFPASIEGEIDDTERRLTGRFKQAGFNLAIDFVRNEDYAGPKLNRPQHPAPPYPYAVREVAVRHPDGHVLAGTLTLPEGEGPFPGAILISGSGPQDRDETIFGHKPFLVIADFLTRARIAVLRYDDRGTGKSTGRFAGATTEDFATDALAVLDFLRSAERVDPDRIGLIGHSEGAIVAPMVAGLTDNVAFVVLLAAPAVPGDELLRLQTELILKAGGADEQAITTLKTRQAAVFELILGEASDEQIREALRPVLEAQLAAATGMEGEQMEEMIELQMKQLASEWMRFFMTYDPRPALARLACPVLALNGELDLQVWHEQNLPEIERVIREAGGDITVRRYTGLNHLFQPATTGSIMEYGNIEITFDEKVLHDVVEWIARRVGS
ncbi:MAG: alpha/beta hydrolase family protein [Planctomycetota bacterium]